MKHYSVLIFILNILCFNAYSQNLSLDQLIAIQKIGDVDKVNTYLLDKGWEFSGSDPTDSTAQVVWRFRRSANSERNAATINVLFCSKCDEEVALIYYRTPEKQLIDLMKQRALYYKMDATTVVKTETISTIYRGLNYNVTITTEKAEIGGRPSYAVELTKIHVMDASPK